MPINYKKYPANWFSEIRPRILKRANNKCEFEGCGLENGSIVHSFKVEGKTVWKYLPIGQWYFKGQPKSVKVILTVAHLDHDEENPNVKDERLMAMCQLHHLRYDIEEKKRRNNLKK